jgi:hypothetical protein
VLHRLTTETHTTYKKGKIEMKMTNEMILETRENLRKLCIEEGSEGLERVMQKVVNSVAVKIAEQYPEVAEENPKEIGKMAKAFVFAHFSALANL